MFSKKKKNLQGFEVKPRTRQEVDADYAREAMQLGHKSRVLAQINEDAMKVEKEIQTHLTRLLELNTEGMKLPPIPEVKTEEVAS